MSADLSPGGIVKRHASGVLRFSEADRRAEKVERWEAGRADREAAHRAFCEARGWIDPVTGRVRRTTTVPDGQGGMVTVDLDANIADQATVIGEQEWRMVDLTDEERRGAIEAAQIGKVLGGIKASAIAADAAHRAQTYGPGEANPGYAEAMRRLREGPARGVAGVT